MVTSTGNTLRRIALDAQGLTRVEPFGRGIEATHRALEQLGYVQIDTISIVARAHHHTFWNRVPNYDSSHLDRLVRDGRAFEYWFHAASYLPMRDYRYALPRMHALRSGEHHWFAKDRKLMRAVLDRIRAEGPLLARDFETPKGAQAGLVGLETREAGARTAVHAGRPDGRRTRRFPEGLRPAGARASCRRRYFHADDRRVCRLSARHRAAGARLRDSEGSHVPAPRHRDSYGAAGAPRRGRQRWQADQDQGRQHRLLCASRATRPGGAAHVGARAAAVAVRQRGDSARSQRPAARVRLSDRVLRAGAEAAVRLFLPADPVPRPLRRPRRLQGTAPTAPPRPAAPARRARHSRPRPVRGGIREDRSRSSPRSTAATR